METMSRGVRSRRQWQIQDGPQGTLRQLRQQLAEDGCVESQVILAKRLLVDSVDANVPGTDWRNDTTQAVSWLTKASEYGNLEAADLLIRCLKSETGITDQNRSEVTMCVDMTDGERSFRCAARKLFASLTPFGQEFVTIRQLKADTSKRNVHCKLNTDFAKQFEDADNENRHSSGDSADHGFSKWYQEASIFEVRLSEGDLIEIAGSVARGEVPRVSLMDVEETSLDDCGVKHTSSSRKLANWIVRAPTAIQILSDLALDNPMLLPIGHLQTVVMTVMVVAIVLILVLLACVLPIGNLLVASVAIVAFYTSLVMMAITTVQMMSHAKQRQQFATWTRLFRTADDTLDIGQAESNFYGRQFVPQFLLFFIAMVCLTCARSFCPMQALFPSELTVLSTTLFVASVIQLSMSHPSYTWHARAFLLGTGTLTVLRLSGLDKSYLQSRVTDAIVVRASLELVPVAILIFAFLSAAFRGQCKSCLPNLVAVTWLHLAAFYLPNATLNGVIRGFGIQVVILVLPFVAHLIIPVLFLAIILLLSPSSSSPSTSSFWSLSTESHSRYWYAYPMVAAVSIVPIVIVIWKSKWTWRKFVIGIEVLSGLLLIVYFMTNIQEVVETLSTDTKASVPSLDWKIYSDLCHEPTTTAERTSTLEMHINCRLLSGLRVRWSGHVRSIRIAKIRNTIEDVVGLLPSSLAAKVRCLYGKPHGECGVADRRDARTCAQFKSAMAPLGCHLVDHDRYDFEVEVSVESQGYWTTADVVLMAGDSFRGFAFQLVAGDRVNFDGILETPMTIGRRPIVRIDGITCVDCVHGMGASWDTSASQGQHKWKGMFRSIFNFVLHPHVELQINNEDEI